MIVAWQFIAGCKRTGIIGSFNAMKRSRRSFIAQSAFAAAGLSLSPFTTSFMKEKSIVHHVFFWLKNPSSKEDKQKLIAGLETLRKIKTVKQLFIGVPAATEKRDVVDNSFQVSELMFFDDLAGQKAYQDDPLHKKFVADCGHLWEKVLVYDVQDV